MYSSLRFAKLRSHQVNCQLIKHYYNFNIYNIFQTLHVNKNLRKMFRSSALKMISTMFAASPNSVAM